MVINVCYLPVVESFVALIFRRIKPGNTIETNNELSGEERSSGENDPTKLVLAKHRYTSVGS